MKTDYGWHDPQAVSIVLCILKGNKRLPLFFALHQLDSTRQLVWATFRPYEDTGIKQFGPYHEGDETRFLQELETRGFRLKMTEENRLGWDWAPSIKRAGKLLK